MRSIWRVIRAYGNLDKHAWHSTRVAVRGERVERLRAGVILYLILLIGLFLLIKGADWLVRGSSSVARVLHVSEFVIGLTVVSFGTSLPELVICVIAALEGDTDISIGNIVGSNIANILLILGIASTIFPLTATQATVWREIPFTLMASVVLIILLNDAVLDNASASGLGRIDGLVLLSFFCIFLYYIANAIRNEQNREWVGEREWHGLARSVIEIVVGLVGLLVGGRMAVYSAAAIATDLGMSQVFVGLTIVAVGTSLPELATSAVAAYRRNADIAVGNVVGSNIFNIFIVMGITSVIHPLPFNPGNNIDLVVIISATLLLFVFMFIGHPLRTIHRMEGGIFVLVYVAYLAFAAYRG